MSAETTHGQAAHSLSAPDTQVDVRAVSYTHLTLPTKA